ncbi:MAG: HipA domain-containing protein [Kiritimatiellae bacterium]|nr:HipA domain-containing protein [Kiritimatiellia bacterium]
MTNLPFTRAELNLPIADERSPRRSSVSGVQDKVELARRRGRYEVVESGGEYLLKPIPSMPLPMFQTDVPANEDLTMTIAGKIFGIEVARHELVRFADGELGYMTRRFDYRNGLKIPQEDFCQLSGRTRKTHGSDYKYNASYEECAHIVRRFCPAAKIELPKLFRRVLFCYLFSNGDAHLKNFSIYASRQGDAVLTPAYDLLSTSLHIPNESPLALDLFADGHFTQRFEELGFFSKADFLELGDRFGLTADSVKAMLTEFPQSEAKVVAAVEASLLSADAKTNYLARFHDRVRAVMQ